MKTPQALVIGSGFSGLSAAAYLAKAGYQVRVLEKNEQAGGRARQFSEQGFVFDMGPSWYWMPDVFESFYQDFGYTTSQFYTLKRLDPSYRVYRDSEKMDLPADPNQLMQCFEQMEPGAGAALQQFLKEAAIKYQYAMKDLVYNPGLSITEFINKRVLKSIWHLHLFKSLSADVRSRFSDERLIQLLEFPVLFLGAKPEQTPAMYSLMNHADMNLGTWYPMGGMYKIVEAMVQIAQNVGVQFQFNEPVNSMEIQDGKIVRVLTNRSEYTADVIVASADYNHIDQHVLPEKYRSYSPSYWDSRTLAPSSLIFYLGINKKIPGILHHNLFFDADFSVHAKTIYDTAEWPEKPLFYVSAPSVTDPHVAPLGMENLFVLVPLAPGLEDTEERREALFQQLIQRIEKHTGVSIADSIVYKKSYAHRDFVRDYHAFKGNAYGLANTLRQTAVLKPKLRSKKIQNLFYTGQLTVPGPGVPPSLISGKIVSQTILNQFKHAR